MPIPDGFVIRQVRGDYEREVNKLRKEARRAVRSTLRRTLTAETKAERRALKESARRRLPQRGGLAAWAAVTPTAQVDISPTGVTARIVMNKRGHDLKALDEGTVRHPVHGTGVWVAQRITPGFFSDTVRRDGGPVGRRVERAIKNALDNL